MTAYLQISRHFCFRGHDKVAHTPPLRLAKPMAMRSLVFLLISMKGIYRSGTYSLEI
ncbi:hypothetical protein X948_5435 [Burkholderia pseudomallei MSHR5608]|nr:hypothetical protein X948_5435 [Burkholderia pseudomallei MSHR5608]